MFQWSHLVYSSATPKYVGHVVNLENWGKQPRTTILEQGSTFLDLAIVQHMMMFSNIIAMLNFKIDAFISSNLSNRF